MPARPVTLTVTPELWLSNLLLAAKAIANSEQQEERWLAPDATAWERPESVINDVYDGALFEEFIEAFRESFSGKQRAAISKLHDELNKFNEDTPKWLDPAKVLVDPRWESIRHRADEFVEAFTGTWPPANRDEIIEMQRRQQQAYADANADMQSSRVSEEQI